MDELDIYRICIENNINPNNVVNMEVYENKRGGTNLRIHYYEESNLIPHISHNTTINLNKTKNSYNPDFDFPEDFELSNKLFEEYWNKKIQKHGSLENALRVMHKIGINPNIRENDNNYLSKPNNSTSDITLIEDRSDLEHKMRQMITIANSINLPRTCLTDKQHYIGLKQSVNSIVPGDKSSYSSLERSVNELKKNWR